MKLREREELEKMKGFNKIFTFLIPGFGLVWIIGLLYLVFMR